VFGRAIFFLLCGSGLLQGGDLRPDFTAHVPMRDGVRLATDIYLPPGNESARPVILIRTPYGRGNYNREYGSWRRWGYAIAIQDTRRRTASGEEALAFVDDGWGERQDGADTVRWLSRQSFCNGKVGTVGASAMGITQYMLAPAAPDNLVCQYILVGAASLYHHASYWGGEFRKNLVEEWLRGNGYERSLKVAVSHPLYDDYWRGLDSTRVAHRVRAAAIHYGGWFDCFLEGTIAGYVSRVNSTPKPVARRQKLLIGPWLHGGPSAVETGDFVLPPNARRAPSSYSARLWFDHWLKGRETGAASLPPVTYYLMGPLNGSGPGNVWKTASSWPPPASRQRFYLRADGSLCREPPADEKAHVTLISDPGNPVPTLGGANLILKTRGPCDQRPIEKRPDVLVFSTAPLKKPLEITGAVRAFLWIECNVRDTDIAVRLADVYPDGRSILICDGIRRAALREGFPEAKPLPLHVPTLIPIEAGTTAVVFAPGHRLRIIVSGSNFPRFRVNPNTAFLFPRPAGPVTAESGILLGGSHASYIEIPAVGEGK